MSLIVRVRKARIALLEGERRSFDNVKLDLMRRIKMLEYALRVERYVFLYDSASFARVCDIDVSCRQLQAARPARHCICSPGETRHLAVSDCSHIPQSRRE